MIVITNIVALNKSPKGRFLKWLRMELGVEEVEGAAPMAGQWGRCSLTW